MMNVRPPMRQKRAQEQPIANRLTIVAPYKGLNARDPEALMQPGYATVLSNLWPRGLDLVLRKGAADFVTGFPAPVKGLFSYSPTISGSGKLFATTDQGVYDATSAGAVGASVQTLTSGWCQGLQYKTTGGSFLALVNGADDYRYYNGSTWTSAATLPINGGGNLTTNTIIGLASHQRRLWLCIKDSIDAYYLDVNSITGTVYRFTLGAYFTQGGYLAAIDTWTVDGGNGPDDHIAFISSKGQVAIYGGTDPAFASSWELRGVYSIPEPIGRRCTAKLGGDLLILTKSGVYPLSALIKGRAISPALAISDAIFPLITSAAQSYGSLRGWGMETLLEERMLLINVPTLEAQNSFQYAMNTDTGAWTTFTGWNGSTIERHEGTLYLGGLTKVMKIWTGTQDFNDVVTGIARGHFDYFSQRGRKKMCQGVIPFIKAGGGVSIEAALDTDFSISTAFGATSFTNVPTSVWDAGTYGTSLWAADQEVSKDWQGVPAYPFNSAALRLRITSKDGNISWTATDFIYELGAIYG